MKIDASKRLTEKQWYSIYVDYQIRRHENPRLSRAAYYRELLKENNGQLPFTKQACEFTIGYFIARDEEARLKLNQGVNVIPPCEVGSDNAEITAVALPEKPARSKPKKADKSVPTSSLPASRSTAEQPCGLEAMVGNICFRIPDRAAAEIFCDIAARLAAQGI